MTEMNEGVSVLTVTQSSIHSDSTIRVYIYIMGESETIN